ncbi:MAG: hypothetical protein J5978_06045 [Spirochaetaceae bacterium]|nr:hypothetical protein [Spirochaetaceae bacterium]
MLSVIKQELFIHKKNILIMSVLIIGLYVGCGILNGLNNAFNSETITEISALWFSFSMIIGTFGAFFVALIRGSGSVTDILFRDTGTLMKTIPVSSWKLIGGKMIVGLLEFLIYGVLFLIFALIFSLFELQEIPFEIKVALKDFIPELVTLGCSFVIGFFVSQSVINFAQTLFATFGKKTRWGKFIIGFLIYLGIYYIFRIIGSFLDVINFEVLTDIMDIWIPLGIFTVVGALFFVGTCILYEKKVNI